MSIIVGLHTEDLRVDSLRGRSFFGSMLGVRDVLVSTIELIYTGQYFLNSGLNENSLC
jgi:hypothetical protein